MKKEKTYNEAVDGDEGFVPGEGYPSCDGEPCANVSDDSQDGTDTMADAAEGGDKAGAGSDLTAALAEWQDKFIRLQAEFDNYRKRTLKEKMDLVQTGGRDVLLAMLPVRDDVQRAVDAMQKSDDIEALRAGVMLISQKFTDTLRQKGVISKYSLTNPHIIKNKNQPAYQRRYQYSNQRCHSQQFNSPI